MRSLYLARSCRKTNRRRSAARLESLEPRRLLAATAVDDTFAASVGGTTSLNASMGVMSNDLADLSPIMHYPLDENPSNGTIAEDITGNRYYSVFAQDFNGAVNGDITSVPGMAGTAYRFDGNNDYIDLGPVYPMWQADSFTFATWFNREADVGDLTNHNVANVLLAQSSDINNDNLEIGTVGSDIVIYLDGVSGETTTTYSNPNIDIQNNVWYHLAVTYDGTELKIFLDGAEVASDTASFGGMFDDNDTDVDTTPLSIGAARPDRGNPWGDFQGAIDDVQIYVQALSPEQIADLHANPGTIVADSPRNVDGFLTAEATLNYDADLENDLNWESSPPVPNFDIGLDSSVTLETVTSDFPGIQQAYRFTGNGGGSLTTLEDLPGDASNESATWELWVRPTGAPGPQTLFESGGNGDGMLIWYDGGTNQINFTLDDTNVQDTVSGTLPSTTEFTQVVGVYGKDSSSGDPSDDVLYLYLNGVRVAENMGRFNNLDDWAGGNTGEIAQIGANNFPDTGQVGDYVGDIAKMRFYEEALSDAEVRSRFTAVAASVSLQNGPTNATSFVLNRDGSFDYTNDGTQGPDSFTYILDDGLGNTSTATAVINVVGSNVGPIADPDEVTTDEDSPVTFDVVADDMDPDNSPTPLVLQSVDDTGLLGTVSTNGNLVTYDPGSVFQALDETQTATETFTYTIFDGIETDTATVTVTINGLNDAPIAAADSASTDEDTAVSGNVLANDTDIDGVDNSFTLNFDAALDTNGDAWEDSAGQLDWRLDSLSGTAPTLTNVTSGMSGITQAYQFTGGGVGGDNAFQLVNNADDDFRSGQDIPGNASNNNVTVELWFKPDSLPLPGSGSNVRQTLFEDGGGTGLGLFVEGNELVARKLPSAGEIRFDISDPALSGDFIQAVVTYRLTGVNPDEMELFVNGMSVGTDVSNNGNDWTGGDGAAIGGRGQANTGGQGGGDQNSESFSGQIAIFRLYESILPMSVIKDNFLVVANGSGVETKAVGEVNGSAADVGQTIVLPSGASLTLDDNGDFTYDPAGVFDAASSIDTWVDTFQYTVDDGSGGTATETVTITIGGVNDPPVTVTDMASATESGSTTILSADVLSNDFDIDALVAPYATLNFNASIDTQGDAWEDAVGQLDWRLDSDPNTGGGTPPVLTNVTSNMAGISKAYQFVGGGTNRDNGFQLLDNANDAYRSGQDIPGNASNDSVSIEVWFKPDSLPLPASGPNARQILFEDGGGTGLGLFIEGNELVVKKRPPNPADEIRFDISDPALSGDFIQAVATYRTDTDPDQIELFVNGTSVGAIDGNNGGDWTGGDGIGIGARGESNTGGQGNGDSNSESFSGQIAIFRLYERIMTVGEVQQNFDAVATGMAGATIVDFDSTSTAGASVSLPLPTESPIGETGVITGLELDPVSITLTNAYTNPVIIATPSSDNGGDIVTARISNFVLDGNNDVVGFDLELHESPNLDNTGHNAETLHYLVIEAGVHTLANGMIIEAGTLDTAATTHGAGAPANDITEFEEVTFATTFSSTPVVLSQVQTTNDTTPEAAYVTTRQINGSPTGVFLAMEQEEASTVEHAAETIGWVAISPGVAASNGVKLEAFRTPLAVDEADYDLNFVQNFSSAPNFVASISTYDGIDPSVLRYVNGSLSADDVTIFVQEDQSEDNETGHAPEVISYMAIEGSGVISSVSGSIGDFSYDTNGQLEFVAAGEVFTDTFTYTLADEFGDTSIGTVQVLVTGENDVPTAADDSAATNANAPVTIDVIGMPGDPGQDVDPDTSDILSIDSIDNTGVQGLVTIDGTTIVYDPNGAFDALPLGAPPVTETFTYIISDHDPNGPITPLTDSATVTVTITPVNDAPVTTLPVEGTAVEDGGPVVISFNSDDPDNDDDSTTLIYNLLSLPAQGDLVDNGDGTFSYDPLGGFQSLGVDDTATVTFNFNAEDQHGATGGDVEATITINGANDLPVVAPISDLSIQEGDSLALSGSATDIDTNDMLSYFWEIDIDGNGNFTQFATGANASLTNAELQAVSPLFGDGPATFDIRLRVNDGTDDGFSPLSTLTLTNAPPTVSIDGPANGVPGFEVPFTLTATDPSLADENGQFTYVINWNDTSPIQTVVGGNSITVPHSFTNFGMITVSATAEDKDEGVSDPDTHVVDVVPVAVIGDDLYVGGSNNSDVIIFFPSSTGINVRVNDVFYGPFSVSGSVLAFGQGGNDRILISGPLGAPAHFDGGIGNDYIAGLGTDDSLVGGPGNDVLLGGNGNNFIDGGGDNDRIEGGSDVDHLFGGLGNDRINGGAGDDIVEGGEGNDLLFGGLGNDLLAGGAGFDTINGHFGNDIILGGEGSDQIFGSSDQDLTIGGAGRDRMRGDAGDDDLIGGSTSLDAAIEADLAALLGGGSLSTAVDLAINAWFATGSDRSGFGPLINDNVGDLLLGGPGQDEFSATDGGGDFQAGENVI